MSTRLILAVISTLLEETALAVIVLVGLPKIGIEVPLGVLIALMVAWGAFSVFTYRIGSLALRRKPVMGLPGMLGSKGRVTSSLAPDGYIRIRGELWEAKSSGEEIDTGEEVIVVGQDGLKLIVRRSTLDDSKGTK